jgi:p-hydroxybenzoate 3-monooxygenase
VDSRNPLVCIVGAGPAGLVLAHILRQARISCVVLERQQTDELRALTKAGLIESRVVAALQPFGLADPILNRGSRNGIAEFRIDGKAFVIDYGRLTDDGKGHFVYPQNELVADWAEALLAAGGEIRFGVRVVDVMQDATGVELRAVVAPNGEPLAIRANIVVGCDGAGSVVARGAGVATLEIAHPFRWLAVIAAAAPSKPRTLYGLHRRGFAGQMRRSATSTRYYLEVPGSDTIADWPDERVWTELDERMAAAGEPAPARGDLIERDFLDLRVRVREPMQSGRMFLAGDAAHLVTPAGGKGMNMAVLDAIELGAGLCERYGKAGTGDRLAGYSATRLPEIWRYEEFSNWVLGVLHAGPAPAEQAASKPDHNAGGPDFAHRLRRARLDRLNADPLFARWFALSFTGS